MDKAQRETELRGEGSGRGKWHFFCFVCILSWESPHHSSMSRTPAPKGQDPWRCGGKHSRLGLGDPGSVITTLGIRFSYWEIRGLISVRPSGPWCQKTLRFKNSSGTELCKRDISIYPQRWADSPHLWHTLTIQSGVSANKKMITLSDQQDSFVNPLSMLGCPCYYLVNLGLLTTHCPGYTEAKKAKQVFRGTWGTSSANIQPPTSCPYLSGWWIHEAQPSRGSGDSEKIK